MLKGRWVQQKVLTAPEFPVIWQKTLKMIIIVTIDIDDIKSYFLRCFRDTSFSACVLAKFVE